LRAKKKLYRHAQHHERDAGKSDAISGPANTELKRSSIVMLGLPPVVALTMISGQRWRILASTASHVSGEPAPG
jgi:hypothetical protein